MLKKSLAAAAALSLTASPVLAQSASIQPASETVAAESQLFSDDGGSLIGPVLFGTIVLLGILLATGTWPFDEDNDVPVSA